MIAKIIALVYGVLLVNGAVVIKNKDFNVEVKSPGLPLFYFGGSAYYFQTFSKATQAEGSLFCKNLDMGLVNVESKRENDFLFDTIGSLVDYETSSFWTSGFRNGKIWYWSSTGKPFSYTHWPSDEPTKENSGSCLEVIHNSTEITMAWNDTDCSATNYIICEGESSATTTRTTIPAITLQF